MYLNLLFIGDIFGKIGRNCVEKILPSIKNEYNINFIIANSENSTHGNGCSYSNYKTFMTLGLNCLTSGNHFLGHKDVYEHPELFDNQLRPLNFPKNYPLVGSKIYNFNNYKIRVTNMIGNTFMQPCMDNPFETFKEFLTTIKNTHDFHLVDYHAEATGEKRAFAEMFSSDVDAIIGTHTHVQTNDDAILNSKTFFITDVGCTGAVDSILGADKKAMILRSAYNMRSKISHPETGLCNFCAVYLQYDFDKKAITKFEKISRKIEV